MPKLHYKKHKKEKKEKKSHGKKRKSHSYKPPSLYEEEGWIPPENSHKQEQDEWQERLFEAMMQDEGQDPFYTNYQQPTPSQQMTDEEYRQHIVQGIYEKRHGDEIKARKIQEKKKRKEREEAERRSREYEKELEQKREAYRKQDEERRSKRVQEEYNLKWQTLEQLKAIKSKDIPWPIIKRDFSLDSVRSFMQSGMSNEEIKKKVRQEQIRYHPDKFMTRVMSRFEGTEKEKERVLSHMNEVSGWLNELWTSVAI